MNTKPFSVKQATNPLFQNSKFEPHYRVSDVCELLSISTATVYRLFESGELKRKKAGRTTLIAESDLLAFLKTTEVQPKPKG